MACILAAVDVYCASSSGRDSTPFLAPRSRRTTSQKASHEKTLLTAFRYSGKTTERKTTLEGRSVCWFRHCYHRRVRYRAAFCERPNSPRQQPSLTRLKIPGPPEPQLYQGYIPLGVPFLDQKDCERLNSQRQPGQKKKQANKLEPAPEKLLAMPHVSNSRSDSAHHDGTWGAARAGPPRPLSSHDDSEEQHLAFHKTHLRRSGDGLKREREACLGFNGRAGGIGEKARRAFVRFNTPPPSARERERERGLPPRDGMCRWLDLSLVLNLNRVMESYVPEKKRIASFWKTSVGTRELPF
ncbi:hypothetical protein CCHR01_08891 [Colletotrichum chrysophilum]|uniref:Uncharacterized protein n=1 Tax=Colletotrichum chrysophilum TaxID=1836956 RepID=A0AAD9AKH2_9PEZI|nr:hypothetical protein CCHR01_08891 [Colletotrichum chrysophilum]